MCLRRRIGFVNGANSWFQCVFQEVKHTLGQCVKSADIFHLDPEDFCNQAAILRAAYKVPAIKRIGKREERAHAICCMVSDLSFRFCLAATNEGPPTRMIDTIKHLLVSSFENSLPANCCHKLRQTLVAFSWRQFTSGADPLPNKSAPDKSVPMILAVETKCDHLRGGAWFGQLFPATGLSNCTKSYY